MNSSSAIGCGNCAVDSGLALPQHFSMGLFDWLFRKSKGDPDRPAVFIAYFDPSESETVQLNRNMDRRELYLVNSANGISCASVLLATVFMSARAQGWEGGAELFSVTGKASYLL